MASSARTNVDPGLADAQHMVIAGIASDLGQVRPPRFTLFPYTTLFRSQYSDSVPCLIVTGIPIRGAGRHLGDRQMRVLGDRGVGAGFTDGALRGEIGRAHV